MKHHFLALILSVIALLAAGTLVWAQEQTPPVQSVQQPQPQQAPPQLLSPQQLNNLVAPIALYPDPLLGQILVASTYPLEVVEATSGCSGTKTSAAKSSWTRQSNNHGIPACRRWWPFLMRWQS